VNTFSDELDNIPLPTRAQATAVASTQVKATTAAAAHDDDDDGVDLLGDYDSLKAQTGLSSVLPKDKGVFTRIALIPGFKAYSRPTHFIAGAGNGKGQTVICPGDGCVECAVGGEHGSRRKIVALCAKYDTTGNDCKLPAGVKPTVTVGYISMSPTAYTAISELPSEGENLYAVDIKVTKKGNNIGWDFYRYSAPPAYTKVEGMTEEVMELAKAAYGDGKVLRNRLGKVVTAQELKFMVKGGGVVDTAATMDDIEGL
jgi:hypothetical protein